MENGKNIGRVREISQSENVGTMTVVDKYLELYI